MAFAITHAEYLAVRNDRSFAVVSFKAGRRLGTYSGLTVIQAMKEILKMQARGAECVVIQNLPGGECSWDRADYDKYLNGGM